jgi:phosphoribosylamine--glycine ligase
LLVKMASGKLAGETLEFRPAATVVKYCVPEGYGDGTPAVGTPVNIHESILEKTGATIYYASIEDQDGLVTLGSRTLAILGEGPTIAAAEAMAEKGLAAVEGDLVVRHDVGTASLIQQRIDHMNQVRYG